MQRFWRIFMQMVITIGILALLMVPVGARMAVTASVNGVAVEAVLMQTEPLPAIPPVPDFKEVYDAGYAALMAVFAGLVSFLATTPLISLIKSIPPFNLKNSAGEALLSGDQINLIIALLFSAITWGATALGYREQITTLWKLVFALLPILAGAGANYFANQKAFGAVKGKMPLVGYSRTP